MLSPTYEYCQFGTDCADCGPRIAFEEDADTAALRAALWNLPEGANFTAVLPVGHEYVLGGSPLAILPGRTITIRAADEGDGPPPVISGRGLSRLFNVRGSLHLKGVHLVDGRAAQSVGSDDIGSVGGAILVLRQASIVLERVLIANCTAAEALNADMPALGGALFLYRRASAALINSTIVGCTARAAKRAMGGAIYAENAALSMTGGEIRDCAATIGDGTVSQTANCVGTGLALQLASGGAITTGRTSLSYAVYTNVTDVTIAGCTALSPDMSKGGAIYSFGYEDGADLTLTRIIFHGCKSLAHQSAKGGAVSHEGHALIVESSTITGAPCCMARCARHTRVRTRKLRITDATCPPRCTQIATPG